MAHSSNLLLSIRTDSIDLGWKVSALGWPTLAFPVHPLPLPLPAPLVPVELAAGNTGGPCMTRRVDTMGWIQTL